MNIHISHRGRHGTHKKRTAHGRNGRPAGFTLVEMMVSVGLFAVVMLLSTSVIFGIINGNRKSQTINSVVNNLNFSIESMIRDIKTGYWYQCGDYGESFNDLLSFKQHYIDYTNPYACTATAQQSITFISTLSGQPRIVQYYFVPGNAETTGRIRKTVYDATTNGPVSAPLTTPDIDIIDLSFYINNPQPANLQPDKSQATQPDVFVITKGNVKIGNKDTDVSGFSIQTYISQRLLNI